MNELPPIYRLFPVDQFNRVDRPGVMISASTDENAALVAKSILHAFHSGGELWADNRLIRLFLSSAEIAEDDILERVWSKSQRGWRSIDLPSDGLRLAG